VAIDIIQSHAACSQHDYSQAGSLSNFAVIFVLIIKLKVNKEYVESGTLCGFSRLSLAGKD
jgi:predicted O-methyltransferase YrrM